MLFERLVGASILAIRSYLYGVVATAIGAIDKR
jgi:hypothetical protein